MSYKRTIEYFYHIPKFPIKILSIHKLATHLKDTNEEFLTGTKISTYAFRSVFVQVKDQCMKTITHVEHVLLSIIFNSDFETFHSFCACINENSNEKLAILAKKRIGDRFLQLHQISKRSHSRKLSNGKRTSAHEEA